MSKFNLIFSKEADEQLEELTNNPARKKQAKAVRKTLGYLSVNPRHPSLNTHEYTSLSRSFGIRIFEAYAENKTPAAFRVFWHYGPSKREITVIAITKHP